MKTTQLLWEFIKQFKRRYIIGIIVLFVTSFISSMIPKIMGYVTDSINDRMPASVTNKYLLILVAATVAVFVLRFTWRYFLVGNNRYLECYLREKLFAHMQTLPAFFYDNNKTGDLIAYAINDIQAIRRVFGFGFTSILDGLVVNTISIIIMVRTINPILTLMAIAPAPLIVMIIYFLRKKIRERFGAVQKAFAQISGKVQENISGIRVIKAFAQEEEEVQDFLRYNQARVDTQMSLTRVSAVLGPVTQLTFGISTVLFIIYGSGLVARGVISLGDYVAFSSYIMVIMGPIVSIGRIIEVWQRGLASIQRLDRIFCERSERDAENALAAVSLFGLNGEARDDSTEIERLKGDIVIKDLTFAYPGTDKKVLQDINL
ncbi:ABC transporter transmembrane domain-containing protein [Caldicoprobacter faecalis]|uniref:ATP-binding cassette, subfamily B n=1 Tax=Caldicoprobacter faecalis TaxID=937334 RepID=A0A1I5XL77_9FIRM|nr:ABC transporter transmembrane domain-containing protein [Caldicoprobacter faecalis]SFQ32698.1 ATP-binding cassette, subfamily B [Caldicoprobacter faecalis]